LETFYETISFLDSESFPPVTREVDVVHGYGKKEIHRKKLLTTLVGVPDLLTCDWFNPEGLPKPILPKRLRAHPFKCSSCQNMGQQNPPVEKQVVFLTNIDVKDPFVSFDRYDDRSLMENKLFREVKQNWHFEHPP